MIREYSVVLRNIKNIKSVNSENVEISEEGIKIITNSDLLNIKL